MKITSFILLGAFGALAVACTRPAEIKPTTAELPPGVLRHPVVGDTYVALNVFTGENETIRVRAVSGGVYNSVNETTGCSWTAQFGQGPSLAWENCNGSDGTQSVEQEGEIWPLQVGNTVKYKVAGRDSTGDIWRTVRSCEVVGTVDIAVPAGEFAAYHIHCEDSRRVFDDYFSPELGQLVVSCSHGQQNGDPEYWHHVSFTPGG